MKILFINAIDPTKPIQTQFPPLGIGYLFSSLRERFGKDTIEFKVVNGEVEQAIQDFQPNLIGISSVSQNFNRAVFYAALAKAHDLPVVVGGVHISMMPSSLTDDMDVGVIGEGEGTICDLIGLYLDRGVFTPESLQSVKGIIYHDNGRLVTTGKRRPIECLDSLPPPARDLFPVQSRTYIFTARGCPFKCTFCASTRFWQGVRMFSPEYIIAEIQQLVERDGVNHICIYDDIFPLSAKRIRDITSGLRERGLLGKVKFECSIRANLVSGRIIALLKVMGVKEMGLGLESGSNKSLYYLKGNDVDVEDNAEAVRIIREHGISAHVSFILGSPYETMAEAMMTYRFVKQNRLLSFDLYLLTPFPGTPVWDYALLRGLVSDDMDWSSLDVAYSGRDDSVIVSEHLTKAEIDGLFARFARLRKRMMSYHLIKIGLRHPERIPGFVFRKMRGD